MPEQCISAMPIGLPSWAIVRDATAVPFSHRMAKFGTALWCPTGLSALLAEPIGVRFGFQRLLITVRRKPEDLLGWMTTIPLKDASFGATPYGGFPAEREL